LRDQYPEAEDRDYVCIAVADRGQGMDENVREHIFEPFFTTKQEGKGSGLGLSIVYGIIMSHHGFIDVETKPGHGSTFKIYLPMAH
jgi:signal transduction histidine kinase